MPFPPSPLQRPPRPQGLWIPPPQQPKQEPPRLVSPPRCPGPLPPLRFLGGQRPPESGPPPSAPRPPPLPHLPQCAARLGQGPARIPSPRWSRSQRRRGRRECPPPPPLQTLPPLPTLLPTIPPALLLQSRSPPRAGRPGSVCLPARPRLSGSLRPLRNSAGGRRTPTGRASRQRMTSPALL